MLDIEVEELTKRFGDFVAVAGLSFTVEHGEVFGLLGPNGAGKSTLIRMLTTLVPPTSGSARVNGFDIVRDPNGVRQSIGVIPQAMTSDLDLSAEENMSIFAKLYGLPREKRRRPLRCTPPRSGSRPARPAMIRCRRSRASFTPALMCWPMASSTQRSSRPSRCPKTTR